MRTVSEHLLFDTTFCSCVIGGLKLGIYVSFPWLRAQFAAVLLLYLSQFCSTTRNQLLQRHKLMMRPSRAIAAGAVAVLAVLLCHHRGQAFFVGNPAAGLLGRAGYSRKQVQAHRSAGVVRSRWVLVQAGQSSAWPFMRYWSAPHCWRAALSRNFGVLHTGVLIVDHACELCGCMHM